MLQVIEDCMVRGAVEMNERVNRLPTAKNWADHIDDLYHDATERNLRAIFWNRPRRLVLNGEKADDRPRGAGSIQREPAGAGVQR